MVQVKKATIDNAVRLSRKHWKTGDVDILRARTPVLYELEKQTGEKYSWIFFFDVLGLCCYGTTNEQLYEVLQILGIEVVK